MAKLTLTDVTATYSLTAINANWRLIEAAVEKQVSRDGTTPNTMSANLDMNSNKIVNQAEPTANSDGATKNYVDTSVTTAVGIPEALVDHANIQNVGTQTHAQIDTHIADTDIHYADAPSDSTDYARNNGAWAALSGALPSQATHSGKYLTTNGSTASWKETVIPGLARGCIPSLAADAAHDITVSAGRMCDSTDSQMLVLAAAITKQVDAAWAVGNNAGGLMSGTVASTTWYHIFLIRRSDTGVVDVGFSTLVDPTAQLPANYDEFRRIGSMRTDASANWEDFVSREVQGGALEINFVTPEDDFLIENPGTVATNRTLKCPTGITVDAILSFYLSDTSPTAAVFVFVNPTDVTDGLQRCVFQNSMSSEAGGQVNNFRIRTDTSAQITTKNSTSAAGVFIAAMTLGWVDFRV